MQTGTRHERVVVQVLGPAHVPLEPAMHVLARNLARRAFHILLGVAASLEVIGGIAGVPAAALQRVEDVVERLLVVRLRTKIEIEV
jgi:hypothetical protein